MSDQLYRFVKASERLPEEPGKLHFARIDGHLFSLIQLSINTGKIHFAGVTKPTDYDYSAIEYLEPVPPADQDKMRECLQEVVKYINDTNYPSARYILSIINPVLASTSDGWIRVEDEMPKYNIGVLVFIPEEDNHITSGMWDISNKWVLLDEYRTVGEGEGMENCKVTHWKPLPPSPNQTIKP